MYIAVYLTVLFTKPSLKLSSCSWSHIFKVRGMSLCVVKTVNMVGQAVKLHNTLAISGS